MYEYLVDNAANDEHELVGLVAYALYKRSKRQWVEAHRVNKKRNPSDDELDQYIDYWTQDRLRGLRDEAASALAAFGDYVIAAERPNIMREAIAGTFWRSVSSSIMAAFIYTLLLIGVAFVLSYAGIDLIGIFTRASG